MQTIPFKRGDTFTLTCSTDQPISGYTIASQIRDKAYNLVSTLTVSVLQSTPTGIYTLSSPTSTATWPIGDLECDIQYTNGSGVIISTETFIINVVRDVTRP